MRRRSQSAMAANPNDRSSDSQADIVQSARRLLDLLTSERKGDQASGDVRNQDRREQRQGGHSGSSTLQPERQSVQMEMTRSFPGIFTKSRGKRRFPAANLVPVKKPKPLEVAFYLLPKQCEKTPNEQEQIIHMQAGLGRRTAHLDESTTHEELCDALNVLFPKMRTVNGGWLLYKSSGGWGKRKLTLVAPEDIGYTGRILKAAGRGTNLYIAPVQEELGTAPLQLTDETFSSMPKASCQKCGVAVPLQFLKEHVKSCVVDINSDENLDSVEPEIRELTMQQCPVCTKMFQGDLIEEHASSCGESAGNDEVMTISEQEQAEMPGPSRTCTTVTDDPQDTALGMLLAGSFWLVDYSQFSSDGAIDKYLKKKLQQQCSIGSTCTRTTPIPCWLTISDPATAISRCAAHFLSVHEKDSPLHLSMDIRTSPAEQDMALIAFYKRPNVEWARPLNCRLEGDYAIGEGVTRFFFSTCMEKLKSGFYINYGNSSVTKIFEGQSGHLVPSASHFLVESDLFFVAGRMMGHSFLHGGPCLAGLSPAVVHVLLGGSPETATVTLQDCPDLDIRETIQLLEGESKLSDQDKITLQDLAYAWDLPSLNESNRRWLFEKLLIHAVIGRVTRQIKQLRRGLKETPMWTVLTQRPDTVALLFPKPGAVKISPEVLLQRIIWPRGGGGDDDDDDDDDYSSDIKCRMLDYLREFIASASSVELTNLVKFWTGWEILPTSLSVEVVKGRYPTASTCFETLRIPGHYKDYTSFKSDLLSCICTCETGFGLV